MMLRSSEVKNKYRISATTLLEWEKQGLLHPSKTPGGHRRYDEDEITRLLRGSPEFEGLGYVIELYYHNYAKLPETIKIMGSSGVDRTAADWTPNAVEPEDYMGVGIYRKLKTINTPTGWEIKGGHPRYHLIAVNNPPHSVVIQGPQLETGLKVGGNRANHICPHTEGEDHVLLLIPELLKYMGLRHTHSWELPLFFMAMQVGSKTANCIEIEPLMYELAEVR